MLSNTIMELLSSEKTYVNYLNLTKTEFIDPLGSEKEEICPKAAFKKIFSVFGVILSYNQLFLDSLAKAVANCPENQNPDVASAFATVGQFLKVYTLYVQGYDVAIQTLTELKAQNSLFNDTLIKIFKKLGDKCPFGTLDSLLIMPVQRIPRYVLFLQCLLKYTNDEKILNQLQKQYEEMKLVASHINSKAKDKFLKDKVTEIEKKMIGDYEDPVYPGHKYLTHPLRSFVLEAELSIDGKKKQCYLFNDMFMEAKLKSDGEIKPECILSLLQVEVNEHASSDPLALELKLNGKVTKVLCKTQSERSDWAQNILNLNTEMKEREHKRLEMIEKNQSSQN
eukprot:TRINITY_DN148_c4_g1_i13.p1 TRINITY_DN148_c4_g1~~TRINITY_DN148_c4_g1_i13.p1  ORF type:complete len:338 (-),score=82.81 TRINITY_DN148_c4_g1_i13:221-1234(-)